MNQKAQLNVRLFFNLANRSYYVQIGGAYLFTVRQSIVFALADAYKLDIIHADDVKHMQEICNNDKN